jgi:hypothetical protein
VGFALQAKGLALTAPILEDRMPTNSVPLPDNTCQPNANWASKSNTATKVEGRNGKSGEKESF